MKTKDLTSVVFADIREKIVNLQLLPGVKISDKEIAEKMGISRSPVRQALFRLTEHGLLEARHNRGFIVKTYSVEEIEDLYILREALELKAIDLFIEHLTDDTAKRLNKLVEGLKPLIEKNDIGGITDIDWQFHQLIIEGGKNDLMIEFFVRLKDRIKISFPHLMTPGTLLWVIYDEHKQIGDNILFKNAPGAKHAMSTHIKGALQYRKDASPK